MTEYSYTVQYAAVAEPGFKQFDRYRLPLRGDSRPSDIVETAVFISATLALLTVLGIVTSAAFAAFVFANVWAAGALGVGGLLLMLITRVLRKREWRGGQASVFD